MQSTQGAVSLTSQLALKFTEKLKDQTVQETEEVTLQCRLSKPYRNVHWLTNSYLVPPYDRITIIAGKFIHRLIIRNVTPVVSGEYRCVCDNVRTSCTVTVDEFAPKFAKKLESKTVYESETVTLECQLSKQNTTAQWKKNDQSVVPDDRITTTVDTYKHQLIIRDVTREDAGNFQCVYGNVKTECTLRVQELALEFTNTLENQSVYKTVTVTLECRLSQPNKTVQWVHNGQQIRLDDRIIATVAIYTHRLIIQDVTIEDDGTVQCVCGNVSTHCIITVKELPESNDWFDGERYCNWVKTSVSLCFMKEGITKFSNDKASEFHKNIKERVAQRNSTAATTTCKQCTHKQAHKAKGNDKNTTTWRMDCNMNICSVWLEEILPHHRNNNKIEWKNSDPMLWPSNSWEIAKLFQPFGCQDQHKAEDCDAAGLLTLILNCRFFNKYMPDPKLLGLLQQIKDVRNVCMHSKDLIMKDGDMEQSLDLIVTFLGEPELKKYEAACEAADKITQLRDKRLDLLLKNDLGKMVLEEKLTEVKNKITRSEDTDNNLRGGTDKLSVQQDTSLGVYRKKRKDFQDMCSKVENIIQEKDLYDIKKTFTEFMYLMNRLQALEQDNREVDEYYQPNMSTLESKQQDVNYDSQERTEQPRKSQSSEAAPALCFSKQLMNQTVYERATAPLECQLSQPNQTVRWLKGVTQVCSSDRITVEADTYTHRLIIRDVTLEDAGTYWCFCDNVGELCSSCSLEVIEHASEFINKLENHTVMEAVTVTLGCQLSKPNETVQWLKNNNPVVPDDRITVTADEYVHCLTITDVTLEDAGCFRCICDEDSTHCTLTVKDPVPYFLSKLENQTNIETETVTLKVVLSKPYQKVVWTKDDVPVYPDDRITITTDNFTHQLIICHLTLEDAGNFRCVCDAISSHCTITVEELPVQCVKPLEDTQGYTKSSTSTTLSCELDSPNKHVRWTKDGQAVSGDDNLKIVSGVYTHQLVFSKLTQGDAGIYTCSYSDVSTTAFLTVHDDDAQAARELLLCGTVAEELRKTVRERRAVLQRMTFVKVDLSSLGDQLANVFTLQHLVKLDLGDLRGGIKLSHKQCQRLGRILWGSPQLRELTLRNIFCTTHGEKSGCVELDLGGPLRLQAITLYHLPFTRVEFNPALLLRCHIRLPDLNAGQVSALYNLLAARNLQTFTCWDVSDDAAVSTLVDVLSQLCSLQQLELYSIDFGSVTDIRLSATMDQLESVYLNQCNIDPAGLKCLLQQHNLPQRRVKITLHHVTIRGEEDVINKISQTPDTEVELDNDIEYREGEWWVECFIFHTRK